MFQWVSDQCLRGGRVRRKGFRLLRKVMLRLGNPTVRIEYFGRTLEVPFSSDLAIHTADFETYNSNLRRLCRFVRSEQGRLRYVDVGANVGDWAVLAEPGPGDSILLVEGYPPFDTLLKRNVAGMSGVHLAENYLSGQAAAVQVAEIPSNATNRLVPGEGRAVQFETLDSVLERHSSATPVGVIKVDADGFDGRVLAGGRRMLENDNPVVLFEFHPSLWRKAGQDFESVLPGLRKAGYGPLLVYDNQGVLLLSTQLSETDLLRTLIRYARVLSFFYFDLMVFPVSRTDSAARFLESEEAFLNRLPDGDCC